MKLVVVGGGYGGTEVIRQLILRGVKNHEIELISNKGFLKTQLAALSLLVKK